MLCPLGCPFDRGADGSVIHTARVFPQLPQGEATFPLAQIEGQIAPPIAPLNLQFIPCQLADARDCFVLSQRAISASKVLVIAAPLGKAIFFTNGDAEVTPECSPEWYV